RWPRARKGFRLTGASPRTARRPRSRHCAATWSSTRPRSTCPRPGPTISSPAPTRSIPMADGSIQTAASEAALSLDGITCTFVSRDAAGGRYTAVRDTTLTVAPGEFVSVVGPTGCGKSTLLNVAAGLLSPTEGRVRVFGQPLAGINARAGYMFQGEALLPWRSALDNVAAGLEFAGVDREQARESARQWLRRVGLGGFED